MTAVIASEGGRWLRTLLYVITTTTGLWAAVWPSSTLTGYLDPTIATAFGLCLAGAGVSCLYGTLKGNWPGEHIGLPFAIMGTSGFTLMLCWTIGGSMGRGTVAGLALMLTVMLADRWRGVRILARMAREGPRDRNP